ncbi:hypothetical protein P8452_67892 [Trifolium repens]|nr:hypothetical protein P8452_67892 [Trifolium repens]
MNGKVKTRAPAGRRTFSSGINRRSSELIVKGITKIHQCGLLQSTGRPAGAQLGQQQLAYQQQQQQLRAFWANQYQEIKKVTDFKNHSHPWQGSRRLRRLTRMLEWFSLFSEPSFICEEEWIIKDTT